MSYTRNLTYSGRTQDTAWLANEMLAIGAHRVEVEIFDVRDVTRERYDELLAAMVLYISWRGVTKQLTTDQKELFADAVERHRGGQVAYVERWWRSESPTTDEGQVTP